MQLRKSTKAATQLSRQLAKEAKVKQAERKQRRDERRRLQTIIDKLPPMTNPVAVANEVHDEHTVPDNSNELLDLSHPMPSQQQVSSSKVQSNTSSFSLCLLLMSHLSSTTVRCCQTKGSQHLSTSHSQLTITMTMCTFHG